MSKRNESIKARKFEWVEKWAAMTGERAKIDAKVYNTYIVYKTDNGWVREYPDGTIIPADSISIY